MAHTVNVPLLRKVLEHITEHPKEHDQGVWARRTACGTSCCLAGWAVQFAGHELAFSEPVSELSAEEITTVMGGDFICEKAQAELGLTYFQASALFRGDNTLADLWQFSSRYTDGEIEIPAQFRGES